MTTGSAYLMAGALHLTADGRDSLHSDRVQAYMNIGYHGRKSDMSDSADTIVVTDLHGGQFDLEWCSISCMREWFLKLFQEIETRASSRA